MPDGHATPTKTARRAVVAEPRRLQERVVVCVCRAGIREEVGGVLKPRIEREAGQIVCMEPDAVHREEVRASAVRRPRSKINSGCAHIGSAGDVLGRVPRDVCGTRTQRKQTGGRETEDTSLHVGAQPRCGCIRKRLFYILADPL